MRSNSAQLNATCCQRVSVGIGSRMAIMTQKRKMMISVYHHLLFYRYGPLILLQLIKWDAILAAKEN